MALPVLSFQLKSLSIAADTDEEPPSRRMRRSEPGASSPEPMPDSVSDGQRLVYLNADKHPVPSLCCPGLLQRCCHRFCRFHRCHR